MIYFTCSKCGGDMEAPESIRGENAECPICKHLQKVAGDNPDLMKPLGNLDPICPYCNTTLVRKPKRKSKCPFCGNSILIRTRPQDKLQVLVTQEDAEEISRQYYSGYGRDPENWLREKRITWDQQLGDFNKQSGEHAKNGHWGLYRNCRYGMGGVLQAEAYFILENLKYPKSDKHGQKALSRMKQAIRLYLEVAIFDLNGANNNNEFRPSETRIQFWDIAPAVMDWICELSAYLGIRREDICEMFYETTDIYKGFPFPLTTGLAWRRLDEALTEYSQMVAARKIDN